MTAIAVTIAGSDSGGGAGIQADLKTFSALGVYGASVITALTAQNTLGVAAVHDVPAAFVTAQIDAVFSDLRVDAVKIGMLSQPGVIEAVAAGLDRYGQRKIVLDPVMVATSGDVLLAPEAVKAIKNDLLPLATLVTPNLPEAAILLGSQQAHNEEEMVAQGKALLGVTSCHAVLIKGGHCVGDDATDILVSKTGFERFVRPRVATPHSHGTGCTLSAAIAALLSQGVALAEAVDRAKTYVWEGLRHGHGLGVGKGRGPVDHLFAIRGKQPPA